MMMISNQKRKNLHPNKLQSKEKQFLKIKKEPQTIVLNSPISQKSKPKQLRFNQSNSKIKTGIRNRTVSTLACHWSTLPKNQLVSITKSNRVIEVAIKLQEIKITKFNKNHIRRRKIRKEDQ